MLCLRLGVRGLTRVGLALLIEPLAVEHASSCEAILRGLPEWFAIEESIRSYVESLRHSPGFIARDEDRLIGFLAITEHNPVAAEILVMGVLPEFHRQGVGRSLLAHAESWLRSRGTCLLHVKSRGPSAPDSFYAQTRKFYGAMGFRPLFETTAFWGEQNPTLVLVKPL